MNISPGEGPLYGQDRVPGVSFSDTISELVGDPVMIDIFGPNLSANIPMIREIQNLSESTTPKDNLQDELSQIASKYEVTLEQAGYDINTVVRIFEYILSKKSEE